MPEKSCKIFLARGEQEPVEFMWADVTSDQSVMIGLLGEAVEEVEFAVDQERGEIRKPVLVTERRLAQPKVTYHASGQYKLSGRMGLDSLNLDRATVEGPPLAGIAAPRRMMEILVPGALPPSRLVPTERDIVLTAPEGVGPLRCTISCMAKTEYQQIAEGTLARLS